MTREEENRFRQDKGRSIIHWAAGRRVIEHDGEYRAEAVDAIADILHALEARGIEPEAALSIAWRHFKEEREERD